MADSYYYEHGKMLPPEKWERPGKPEWESFLTVTFKDRSTAWELVKSLTNQLSREESDPSHAYPFQLTFAGELHKVNE